VLITLGVGTRRNNGFADIQGRVPTDTLKGRKIIGQGTDPSSLWLARPAIMEWCRLKGANHYELHRKAVALGWASDRLSQRILAQGTDLSSGAPVWCWIMDPDKMPDVSPEPALTVIQGGKAGRGRP
jgi:hypothetical protein